MKRHDVDVLVGTCIMGWEYDGGEWLVEGQYIRPSFVPSVNLAHAWEVVEIIASPPHTLEKRAFSEWWNKACLWSYKTPTAALAICRKALETRGVIISEDISDD